MIKKSVLIIGSSSDIGKATALLFAKKGYNIIATYNRCSPEYLKDLENICNIKTIKMDITDMQSIEKGFEDAFSSFDYIESVIICPGISKDEMMLIDMPNKTIEQILNVNLLGVTLCNKYAAKYLLKKKYGSIVNISSVYGIDGGSCEAAYSASKAGIIGLTKALAKECAPYVRVNAVAPGFIETKMTSHFTKEEKENIKSSIPLKRLGTTEDVANAIYFLSCEASSYITGEILTVSGGTTSF